MMRVLKTGVTRENDKGPSTDARGTALGADVQGLRILCAIS